MILLCKKNHLVRAFAIGCLLGSSFCPVAYGAIQFTEADVAALYPSVAGCSIKTDSVHFGMEEACLADFKMVTDQKAIDDRYEKGKEHAKSPTGVDEAIPLFEENANYGHTKSMGWLGIAYKAKAETATAVENKKQYIRLAYTWFLLAFEEHWLNKGKPLPFAKDQLLNLEFKNSVLNSLTRQQKKKN